MMLERAAIRTNKKIQCFFISEIIILLCDTLNPNGGVGIVDDRRAHRR